MADDELLHLLELPSSEFGPMNDDLSDDGGWMSDVSIDDRADLETFTELRYMLDLIVFTGKESEILETENLGLSGAIITTLLAPYLNKGHCLYVDSWYSSPDLFMILHLNKTNACGTVRWERLGMPEFRKELQVGEREVVNDGRSMVVRWIDKREVMMITTEHDDKIVETGKVNYMTKEKIMKPKCIQEYNYNMGAVDRTDMMLSNVSFIRRTQKWYKKLFLHFLDLAILNSHAVYLTVSGKKPTLSEFHLELIRQFLEENMATQSHSQKTGGRPSPGEPPLRLTQRHFPTCIPSTDGKKEYPT
ncbi:piggyBac transposable element-derived protein 4-like, partial [Homalodisca vitripennis]|uniref:piggyBac transposable element-derived protein 4-like n=1 Tax=Homalodisca vitripennis TaxID=197043 RepID=UPI001EEA72FE